MTKRFYASIFLIFVINILFSYKYFNRAFSFALPVSILYSIAVVILCFITQKSRFKIISSDYIYWGTAFLYIVFCVVVFRHIKVEQLNVDRWSIISGFWDHAFNGKFPYSAQSHMGNYPGPLPVYFLLFLPFYLLHEIGYLTLIGFISFVWFVRKKLDTKDSITVLFLLISSVAVFWEISVRSTILVNVILFLFYLYWILDINFKDKKNFYLSAVIGGLLLSTRTIFVLELFMFVVFVIRNGSWTIKQVLWWGTILSLTFIVTFLPFIIFYFDDFIDINPFIIQSEHLLPFWLAPFLILLAGVAGFFSKRKQDLFFAIGIVFFLVFVLYAIRLCFLNGFQNSYMGSIVDLSYILFSLPFLLFATFNHKPLT